MPQFNDPKSYRQRSTPTSLEQARENIGNFIGEVIELMKKHHVADALIVTEACVELKARDLTEEDDETFVTSVAHIGDQLKAVPMAAYGHAFMRVEFDELVNRRKQSGERQARKVLTD